MLIWLALHCIVQYIMFYVVLKKQQLTDLEFTSCVNLLSFVDCVAFELVLNKKAQQMKSRKHICFIMTQIWGQAVLTELHQVA